MYKYGTSYKYRGIEIIFNGSMYTADVNVYDANKKTWTKVTVKETTAARVIDLIDTLS